jgi:hypothetical protein
MVPCCICLSFCPFNVVQILCYIILKQMQIHTETWAHVRTCRYSWCCRWMQASVHNFKDSCLTFKQKFKFKFHYKKINYHIFLQGAGRRMINILFIWILYYFFILFTVSRELLVQRFSLSANNWAVEEMFYYFYETWRFIMASVKALPSPYPEIVKTS